MALQRSDAFNRDFEIQYRWYLEQAGLNVAERYLAAVLATLRCVADQPARGKLRRFRHPVLRNLHSIQVKPPFRVHLIFYRYDESNVSAERVMHGARNLPRRLRQPPGTSES